MASRLRTTFGAAPLLVAAALAALAFALPLAAQRESIGFAPIARSATGGAAKGVVVEGVETEGTLAQAGVRCDDVLLRLGSAEGSAPALEEIRDVFDWERRTRELSPRGVVRLEGLRQGVPVAFDVQPGLWKGGVHPRFAAADAMIYAAALEALDLGDRVRGLGALRELALRVAGAGDLSTFLLWRIGQELEGAGDWPAARDTWQQALVIAASPEARLTLLIADAQARNDQGDVAAAAATFGAAIEWARGSWGEGVLVAGLHGRRSVALRNAGRMREAETEIEQALASIRRLAPESLTAADIYHAYGALISFKGDLDGAESWTRRALALRQRWAPDSPGTVSSLYNLAIQRQARGDYAEAGELLRQARARIEARDPQGPGSAYIDSALGVMALGLGDTEEAQSLFARALAAHERLPRGDLPYLADLLNLAEVGRARRDLAAAESYGRRALQLAQSIEPDGSSVADALASLAETALAAGRAEEAERLQRQALRIVELLAPGSVLHAAELQTLARIVLARGAARTARDLAARAVAIQERALPESVFLADSQQILGQAQLRQGEISLALASFRRGLEALEAQDDRLGAPQEGRTRFRGRHHGLYLDTLEAELRSGAPLAAFQTLERSRARSLLHLLAERDLALDVGAPAGLEAALRQNAALYDRAQQELFAAGLTPERARLLTDELGDLRRQRAEIAGQIRRGQPQLATLGSPQSFDLEAARDALDPGTVGLAYSIGAGHSHLFVLSRQTGLRVLRLPVGEERLRREVEAFLTRIAPGGPGGPGRGEDPAFRAAAIALYRLLVAPAEPWTKGAERLLLLADGPLHRLPFAALIRPNTVDQGARGRAWSYLAEWKPLHSALSLTLYAALQKTRRTTPLSKLVAFGDPSVSNAPATDSGSAVAALRRQGWGPLPESRSEIERIAALYAQPRLFLGERATEEEAKGLREADILHFATHAFVDDRSPLDSALVLAIPEPPGEGRDNGLLQAWEIFERLRLPVDLVVLSACGSGLGEESSGEGLIGLTWAFQYAGARTVSSSLWSVSDQTTAELMVRFYRHLAAGESKDRALQSAQRELIDGPLRLTLPGGQVRELDASPPYSWAAFQLLGDWR